jgi:hypothetical protein
MVQHESPVALLSEEDQAIVQLYRGEIPVGNIYADVWLYSLFGVTLIGALGQNGTENLQQYAFCLLACFFVCFILARSGRPGAT